MRSRLVKRVLDVAIAGAGLVATTPILAVACLAIVVESPGPVLFRQARVGKRRQLIQTLKLRTMVDDAASRGPQITTSGDPRITRVGRWLRRSKLDELPQLWNVVRGDMSLVGPRPEVPRYVETYGPEWDELFTVRPGITDLATVTFRDEERLLARATDRERAYREVIMPMKLGLSLEGVRNGSIARDLEMLARTAIAIVRGHDERQATVIAEAERRIAALDDGLS